MRLAAILHSEDGRNRPWRVAGREIERQRGVAERELVTVRRDHVALGLDFRRQPRAGLCEVPIGGGHDDARAELLLQVFCSADMVDMAMTDQCVSDFSRVEAELLQAADDLVLDRVGPDRVDHDDAVGGDHGPGRIFLRRYSRDCRTP
jgi:hypothetical protein